MPLVVVSKLIAAGKGLAPALVRRANAVALDWDTRQKSRFEARDSAGRQLAVFLPRGRVVRGGDVLVGEDGSLIRVEALPQPILVVTAREGAVPDDATLALARAAYHLGNRHVPLEVRADRLVLEPDHVLAELLARFGLEVEATSGAFEPEPGAYEAGATSHGSHDHAHQHDRAHGHGHAHEHDHAHDHGHAHAHQREHAHGHDHVHDETCDHDRDAHRNKPSGKSA